MEAESRTGAESRLLGRSWTTWLPAALVAVGTALRLRQYLSRRSLWNDEAALALNVVSRSYGELVEPLDIDQGAPLGFLWGQRTAVNLFGNNEFALRLIPLLGGVAALVLVAALARRLLSPLAATAAVLLTALLGPLVYYSAEAKQYSTDVAMTLLLLYATVRLLERPVSPRRALAWGALGCACMLMSHPSVLVLAACSLAAAVVLAMRRMWRGLGALQAGVALWVGGLGLLYLVSLRDLRENPSLEAFWQEGYAPQPLRVASSLRWVADVVSGLVPNPIELSAPFLVLALFLAGTAALLVRHPAVGLMVVGVAAAALAAGLIAAYPLKWRLALYLVPVVLLAVAAAVDVVTGPRVAAMIVGVVVAIALAVVMVRPVSEAADAAASPYTVTELRSVLERVEAAFEPTDVVYVHWTAAVLYEYYAPVLGLPARAGYFVFKDGQEGAACPADDPLAAVRPHPRVWAVFAYPPAYDPADSAETGLSQFDRLGPRVRQFSAPGKTQAVLYDTRRGPNPAAQTRTPHAGDCFSVATERG